MAAALGVVSALSACATQGGEDTNGQVNLPDRGIAGWKPVTHDDKAYTLSPGTGATEVWGGPAALVVGDEVVVWFHAIADDDSMEVRVRRSPLAGDAFGDAVVALADARDPSVAVASDDRLWMAFVDASGALGLAVADDVDASFERQSASGLPAAASEPSLVIDHAAGADRLVVFAVVDGAIVRSEAGADLAFGASEVVLAPEGDCVDAFGEDEPCWDETALSGPDVRIATTAAGRRVWRMFFAGRQAAQSDLGFAASYDGHAFSRYATDPVVSGTLSEFAPTSVIAGDDYLLYYVEQRSASSAVIAVARTQPSAPSERW